jgi:hypothetical protein
MSTPEGKVKTALKNALKRLPRCYPFWPVQMGLGAATLDCLLCINGQFVAIETKAPGETLTARQEITRDEIVAAGGIVIVVDSTVEAKAAVEYLCQSSFQKPTKH